MSVLFTAACGSSLAGEDAGPDVRSDTDSHDANADAAMDEGDADEIGRTLDQGRGDAFGSDAAVVGDAVTDAPIAEDGGAPIRSAFPGASGHGRGTLGARSCATVPAVYTVSDEPTLREALQASGCRVVLFERSGRYALSSNLRVRQPGLTLLGHTAPEPGVMLTGRTLLINAGEVIVRGLAIRGGRDLPGGDTLAVVSRDAPIDHVIIDHVDATWFRDGAFDINGESHPVTNVTIQWSVLGEGDDRHNLASLANNATGGSMPDRVTWYRNFFFSANGRTPRPEQFVNAEVINNVVYNWGSRATQAEQNSRFNAIGNRYVAGPSTRGLERCVDVSDAEVSLFVRGNVGCRRESDALDELLIVSGPTAGVSATTASAPNSGYDYAALPNGLDITEAVVEGAGAWHHDEVRRRMTSQFGDGTEEGPFLEADFPDYPNYETARVDHAAAFAAWLTTAALPADTGMAERVVLDGHDMLAVEHYAESLIR
ncbi:MAG: hypothetical protein AAF938_23275 [Myxococcota bacterium]